MNEIVREILLAEARGSKPKIHPHGFIQLDLKDRDRRLHVWDWDIPRTADEFTIHDHVWSFESRVLFGVLQNHVFDVTPHRMGSWRKWEASKDRHDGTRGGKVLVPVDKWAVVKKSESILSTSLRLISSLPSFAMTHTLLMD